MYALTVRVLRAKRTAHHDAVVALAAVPGNADAPANGLAGCQLFDASMKNCGFAFVHQASKFKVLNELIKLVSPKVGVQYALLRVC